LRSTASAARLDRLAQARVGELVEAERDRYRPRNRMMMTTVGGSHHHHQPLIIAAL
jgi:hypothetical protein